MKSVTVDERTVSVRDSNPGRIDRLARRLVLSRLEQLRRGRITVLEGRSRHCFGKRTDDCDLEASLRIDDARFWSDVLLGGSVGAGEAFMHGYWSCDDLSTVVRILLANRDVLDSMNSGAASLARPARRLLHRLNRNTRKGSRRNISAHYDLGNDFYALWLDEQMMYSSAWFETPDTPLDAAAVAKLDLICRKLDLNPGDRLVEIGAGWGGFAMHAARKYGCHVTTTTISKEQYDYASARIREAGLEDRITLLASDYRDLSGRFDKLVSIEMVEAVGHEFHATFFRKCCELLRPGGQMLLQAITIADQRYEAYRKDVDFIRRYIFPGGCLMSVTDMCRVLTHHTDMRVLHLEDIGLHYAKTLRLWRERFHAELDRVRSLGYPERFIRMWHYYLCFCEGAFEERAIGNVQMLIARP